MAKTEDEEILDSRSRKIPRILNFHMWRALLNFLSLFSAKAISDTARMRGFVCSENLLFLAIWQYLYSCESFHVLATTIQLFFPINLVPGMSNDSVWKQLRVIYKEVF